MQIISINHDAATGITTRGVIEAPNEALNTDMPEQTPIPTIEERVGTVEGKTATLEETLDVIFGGIL